MIGDDDHRRLARKILLQLLAHFAYAFIGLLNGRVSRRGLRAFQVLHVVDIDQVQQRQVGAVLVEDQVEDACVDAVALVIFSGAIPLAVLFKWNTRLLAFGQ